MSYNQTPLFIKIKYANFTRKYLDLDGDAITISSQVEFNELWHKITLAARPSQKNGTDQRALSLELVLIDPVTPFQPKQPKTQKKQDPPSLAWQVNVCEKV
ncbi:hypothetical protein PSHT_05688 [Puccinia striiformis]|uniref:Uncharacterized protein n=1 Tax=Puccinia striiformis TaxID=27350 RepID=A0A2S4WA22_9BASI|nr:hypothetical protein PSHT_05688 [Puccinia striiformis]